MKTKKTVDAVSTADFNQLVEATTTGFKAVNEILDAPNGPIYTYLVELNASYEALLSATESALELADEKFDKLEKAFENQRQILVTLFELIGKRLNRAEENSEPSVV